MAMMPRLLVWLLAGAMVALTPAAHASPPDQTWIAGLYDNADYDDAVLAVIASIASLDRQPVHDPQYVDLVIAFVLTIDESLRTPPSLSSNRPRAPPICDNLVSSPPFLYTPVTFAGVRARSGRSSRR